MNIDNFKQAKSQFQDINKWLDYKISPRSLQVVKNIFKQWQTLTPKERSEGIHKAFTYVLNEADSKKMLEVANLINNKVYEIENNPNNLQLDKDTLLIINDLRAIGSTLSDVITEKISPEVRHLTRDISKFRGPHLPLGNEEIIFLHKYLSNDTHFILMSKFLKQCEFCRNINLATMIQPYQLLELRARHHTDLLTLEVDLINTMSKTPQDMPKLNLILGSLKECVLLTNSQIHTDTLTYQLHTPASAGDFANHEELIRHYGLAEIDPVPTDKTIPIKWPHRRLEHIRSLDNERRRKMEAIDDKEDYEYKKLEKEIGYIERMASALLEKAAWKNVVKSGEQFFISGTRALSFLTPDGKQGDVEVPLNLEPLGSLNHDQCVAVFRFLHDFVQKQGDIQYRYPKILPPLYSQNMLEMKITDFQEEIQDLLNNKLSFLDERQQVELIKIALKFSYETERKLTITLMNMGL